MKRYWLFIFAVALSWTAKSFGQDKARFSPKIALRTGTGMFTNEGTSGGSTTGSGGFSLQYQHFLTKDLAAGVGYSALFDANSSGTPISGFELTGRYYFRGHGTVETYQSSWGEYTSQEAWAPYAMALYSIRKFYLGEDNLTSDPAKQLTGEYDIVNAGIGLDYRLNRQFELNAEFNMSLFTFTSTDSRVRVAEKVLWFGVNYVF